jgi:hypothetical protein
MTDPTDLEALKDLRKSVAKERGFLKRASMKRVPIVKVYFRRPELPHGYTHDRSRHWMYGQGGGVRKDQNPREADVYLTTTYA